MHFRMQNLQNQLVIVILNILLLMLMKSEFI